MPFKVEIREDCKECRQPIDKTANKRLRSFCGAPCRNKYHAARVNKPLQAELQRKRQQRAASEPSPDKKKCALCGRWYRRVTFHVFQVHNLTAREYKQHIDAPLSRGILADERRQVLRDHANRHDMGDQLKRVGKSTRYKKNDPRTKDTLNKGRKFEPNEYY